MLSNAYMLIMMMVMLMFVDNCDNDYVDDDVVMTLNVNICLDRIILF